LYPNKAQIKAMEQTLETLRRLYNNALAERKDAWEQEQRNVDCHDQQRSLTINRKTNLFLAVTNCQSCQATLRRLDKAFQSFFRRINAGENPGYPRFKGANRFNTVEFPQYGSGCKIRDGKIYFHHIGEVKVKWHRSIPENAAIKTVSFKRETNKWYVIFSCEVTIPTPESVSDVVTGIDLGLRSFLVTSEGVKVKPPKPYRKAQDKLRRVQRVLARRQNGSNRRRKARANVAKLHQHIANQRRDFHHKLALSLVQQYGTIVHEELHITSFKGNDIPKHELAKSTYDAGWAQFMAILSYKAEEAGTRLIAVPAKNTTQICSVCGAEPSVPITLKDRVYHCSSCNQKSDRDLNAARNILRLGLSLQALTQRVAASVA
jgi:putative transposase